jgi:hypothetical protein
MDVPTKIMIGLIVILIIMAMSPLFLGSAGLENETFLAGVPLWFVPFFLLAFTIFVVRLIIAK